LDLILILALPELAEPLEQSMTDIEQRWLTVLNPFPKNGDEFRRQLLESDSLLESVLEPSLVGKLNTINSSPRPARDLHLVRMRIAKWLLRPLRLAPLLLLLNFAVQAGSVTTIKEYLYFARVQRSQKTEMIESDRGVRAYSADFIDQGYDLLYKALPSQEEKQLDYAKFKLDELLDIMRLRDCLGTNLSHKFN
jgi:hypothetical protein